MVDAGHDHVDPSHPVIVVCISVEKLQELTNPNSAGSNSCQFGKMQTVNTAALPVHIYQ